MGKYEDTVFECVSAQLSKLGTGPTGSVLIASMTVDVLVDGDWEPDSMGSSVNWLSAVSSQASVEHGDADVRVKTRTGGVIAECGPLHDHV